MSQTKKQWKQTQIKAKMLNEKYTKCPLGEWKKWQQPTNQTRKKTIKI